MRSQRPTAATLDLSRIRPYSIRLAHCAASGDRAAGAVGFRASQAESVVLVVESELAYYVAVRVARDAASCIYRHDTLADHSQLLLNGSSDRGSIGCAAELPMRSPVRLPKLKYMRDHRGRPITFFGPNVPPPSQ